ncbi:MAG: hypothetical protein KGJ90_06745 [Patescibacteria group bacterium]|nr:hypothetical protein [Patescibacteria group bacterium]
MQNNAVAQAEVAEMSSILGNMTEAELEAATAPEGPKPANIDNSADVAQAKAPADAKWIHDGQMLAKVFLEGDNTRRTNCLLYAEKYLGNEQAQGDFLKGFKEEMGGTPTAIQTASKIKSIFTAYGVKSFERVVGLDEVTKMPVKATKSGQEWLSEFQGTFEKFAALAREIRGPINGQGAGGGNVKQKTKISDEQAAKIEESVKIASPAQAERILEKAVDQVLTGKDADKNTVAMVFSLVSRLADSQDLAYQSLAEKLRQVLTDFYNKRIALEQGAPK